MPPVSGAHDRHAPALLEARALAGDMLAPIGRGAAPLPLPILARAHRADPAVRVYLVWWARHPDPTGTFATRTWWLRRLPASWLLRAMFALGYDGLVYLHDGTAIGHLFFQRRGDALHGFSTAVGAPFEGGGYSVALMFDFVAYASQVPGIVQVRVGRGQNNVTRRFLQRLAPIADRLGWQVATDGWIRFASRR